MTKENELIPRDLEGDIREWLDSKEILAIRGPRQSGKTTLLYRIINHLKEKKVDEKRIHLITLEDDFEKEKFEKNPKEYVEYQIGEDDQKKHYLLFDEIQYVKNAGKLLKLVYDTNYNTKIIVTGSSTLDLNEIGSYLVGRVIFFELYPFSFGEYLKAKDEKTHEHYRKNRFNTKKKTLPSTLFLDKLNSHLKEYLTYGGYPRVVLEKNHEKKKTLLKNLYLTYIEKDIVKVYGIKQKQRVTELIKNLAALNGSIINYNELGSQTSLYFKELKEALGILEDTYIIKTITPFHKNMVTEIRKNPKIYFTDTGLRNLIANRFEFSEEEFGRLLENHTLNSFREEKISYWRTTAKAEVDFILTDTTTPVEAKTSPKITKSLKSFIKQYKPEKAIITNMNTTKKQKINTTQVYITPASLL